MSDESVRVANDWNDNSGRTIPLLVEIDHPDLLAILAAILYPHREDVAAAVSTAREIIREANREAL